MLALKATPTSPQFSRQFSARGIDLEMTPKKELHTQLSQFNQHRLTPTFITDDWPSFIQTDADLLIKEGKFVEHERQHVQQYLVHMPKEAEAFMRWFEN